MVLLVKVSPLSHLSSSYQFILVACGRWLPYNASHKQSLIQKLP